MRNNQVNMKHVRKWTEGKDSLIVCTALMITAFANEYHELSESVHEGKRLEGDIPIPSLETWFKLYRNPKRIWKGLSNAFGIHNSDTREGEIIRNEIVRMISGNKEKRSEESTAVIEELKEEAINDFTGEVKEEERKEFLKNLTKPEIIFFLRVFAPCFTLYKIYPIELLNRAISGDDKSLDQLIRLDKSAIFEPKISKIIHEAQVLKAQARMSMIKTAFTSPPNAVKKETIKCQLGGLIVFITDLMRHKLKPSDIRKLYDAIARDLRADMYDQDLYEMLVPAFAKRINRTSLMWKIILTPRQKIIL
jgi:hypothetical protein